MINDGNADNMDNGADMVMVVMMVMEMMMIGDDNTAIPNGNGAIEGDAIGCVVSSRKKKNQSTQM